MSICVFNFFHHLIIFSAQAFEVIANANFKCCRSIFDLEICPDYILFFQKIYKIKQYDVSILKVYLEKYLEGNYKNVSNTYFWVVGYKQFFILKNQITEQYNEQVFSFINYKTRLLLFQAGKLSVQNSGQFFMNQSAMFRVK